MLREEFLPGRCSSPSSSAPPPEFWLNLQRRYDLEVAETAIAKELAAIEADKRKAA